MEIERRHVVNLVSPNADVFNTNPDTAVVSLAGYEGVVFTFSHKGGTTGKGTITVKTCTDFSKTSPTAIPFKYRKKTTGSSESWGALTDATSAGVQTVATEDTMYEIEVLASDLAGTDRDKIFLNLNEDVNDPVAGSLIATFYGAKYENPGAGLAQVTLAAAGPVAP